MDPRTGEILALASYPDYDPSLWVGGMSATKFAELNAPQAHFPLFDRVIDGLYPAGSTFKPFVAAAALNAGLITANTTFDCTGKFSVAQQTWKDWIYPGHHGNVNLLQAITESCDVYFYNLGNLLYQQPSPVLQNGVRQFGFGQSTGIDLPGETENSRVPDKNWAADNGQGLEDGGRDQPGHRTGRPAGHPLADGCRLVGHRQRGHVMDPACGTAHNGCLEQHHPPVREREAGRAGNELRRPQYRADRHAAGHLGPFRDRLRGLQGLSDPGGGKDRHGAEEARR